MDKLLRLYRKSVGLTDSLFDTYIRLIFGAHIFLYAFLSKPLLNLFIEFDFFYGGSVPERVYMQYPKCGLLALIVIHLIPRVAWWMAKPIIKKKRITQK